MLAELLLVNAPMRVARRNPTEQRIWMTKDEYVIDADAPMHCQWKSLRDSSAVPVKLYATQAFEQFRDNWMRDCVEQLSLASSVSEGWNGYKAPAPNSTAKHYARETLESLYGLRFRPHSIGPSVEGGIGITFSRGIRHAAIEFHNDGEVLTLLAIEGGSPEISILQSAEYGLAEILLRIKAFIENDSRPTAGQRSSARFSLRS